MPFTRPTLQELVERISSDFQSRLQLNGAILRRSVVAVISRVLAGASHMLHGLISFLARQIFPDTSEVEFLERQANLFRIYRLPATYATGDVDLVGVDGSIIPDGTILQRADGLQYETLGEETITGGTATVEVTSFLAGDAANALAGTELNFVSPISGVDTVGVVASGALSSGTDRETDDALRLRLLERMQAPPHGGAGFDYVAWAKEVAGVTRAWVYPEELGPGTVSVRFVRDNDADIIPDAGEVEAVQEYIDARRPVTATTTVVAPIPVDLDFEIALSPDNVVIRAAVAAELEDLLTREAEPGGTILVSHIREAISVAAGEYDHTLISPLTNVTHTTGEIAVMGEIVWA